MFKTSPIGTTGFSEVHSILMWLCPVFAILPRYILDGYMSSNIYHSPVMSNSEASENTARHMLVDASRGRDISQAYNNLPNDEKQAVFRYMEQMQRGDIPGFPSSNLLLDGIDTDSDGKKDQLGSVYDVAKQTSLYQDRPDSTYVVAEGDTLTGIARRSLNSCLAPADYKHRADTGLIEKAAKQIAGDNRLDIPGSLSPGDELVIDGNLVAPGIYGDKQKLVKNMPLDTYVMGADSNRLTRAEDVLKSLPQSVRNLLRDHGVALVVSRDLCHEEPSLSMDTPRGYDAGDTRHQAPAEYDPETKELRIRQDYKLSDGSIEVATPDNFTDSIRHEGGHAVDEALGDLSHSKEFDDAYRKDVQALTPEQKEVLSYYLIGAKSNEDMTGREETFAQVFAAGCKDSKLIINPDDETHDRDKSILKAFPSVEKLIKERLELLQPGK